MDDRYHTHNATSADWDGLSYLIDAHFMHYALEQARIARDINEVPIGAVVVYNNEIIAAGHNRREIDHSPVAHAEHIALTEAACLLNRWRLSDCTVYVTLEPCIMCAGLMHQARVARCVYGAPDPKAGALGSLYAIHADKRLNHTFEVTAGICREECTELLQTFFTELREKQRNAKKKERTRLIPEIDPSREKEGSA